MRVPESSPGASRRNFRRVGYGLETNGFPRM